MSMIDTQTSDFRANEIRVGLNIKNIRTDFPQEGIEQLAESILRDGLMQPLLVMPTEYEGEAVTELVAGERRLRAIKLLQERDPSFMDKGIPCMVFEGGLHEAKYLNALENIERENIDDVDQAAWVFSRCSEGVSQTDLAEHLHRSLSWVNVRVVFHERAVDLLKQAVRDRLISFTKAYHLARNYSQEEQIKWVKKAQSLDGKISTEDLLQKKEADDPKAAGEKAPSKKLRKKMLEWAQKIADDKGSELARGVTFALRWVDMLDMSTEEFESFLNLESER